MVKASPTLKLSSSVSQDPPQTSVWTWSQIAAADVSTGPHHGSHLVSIFKHLEKNLSTFFQEELKKFLRLLSTDYPECLEPVEDEEQRSSSEALLKITLNFLRRMDQKELAERLWSRVSSGRSQRKLKVDLQQRFECVFEGIAKAGAPTLLKQIYTELYITEGGSSEVNQEHETRTSRTLKAPLLAFPSAVLRPCTTTTSSGLDEASARHTELLTRAGSAEGPGDRPGGLRCPEISCRRCMVQRSLWSGGRPGSGPGNSYKYRHKDVHVDPGPDYVDPKTDYVDSKPDYVDTKLDNVDSRSDYVNPNQSIK
uniref:FISNA domain-containing protein n=1 Tax=Knipowitschia caucasica TaxID=637954 RepID=A0AAV2LNE0_KNICA